MAQKRICFKSIGAVTFSRNKRSRNLKISVKPDKSVLVSFPFFVSEEEVLAFLSKNEAWICRQQEKIDRKKTVYSEGMVLNTKKHSLEIRRGSSNRAEPDGSFIALYVEDFDSEASLRYIDQVLTAVYRLEARMLLPPRLQELARQHGFRYQKVTIRNNRRNWGSCSSRNNISLNLQMMKLPDELIDYILLHELVHTEIKNHSPAFWERLNGLTGQRARKLAGEVKKFSTYTV